MKIYPVRSRTASIVSAAFVAALAVVMFVMLGLPVLVDNDAGLEAGAGRIRLAVTSVFCLFFLWGAWSCLRQVTAIRMGSDGMIEFARLLGSTRIAARDILSLEGKYSRDYDGDLFWKLRIRYRGGRFTFNQFPKVTAFVDQVKAHHPDVEITGLWPMNLPPVRPSSWHV